MRRGACRSHARRERRREFGDGLIYAPSQPKPSSAAFLAARRYLFSICDERWPVRSQTQVSVFSEASANVTNVAPNRVRASGHGLPSAGRALHEFHQPSAGEYGGRPRGERHPWAGLDLRKRSRSEARQRNSVHARYSRLASRYSWPRPRTRSSRSSSGPS